jgi:hypothetical protein
VNVVPQTHLSPAPTLFLVTPQEHVWYVFSHARAPSGQARVCRRCGVVSASGALTGPCDG